MSACLFPETDFVKRLMFSKLTKYECDLFWHIVLSISDIETAWTQVKLCNLGVRGIIMDIKFLKILKYV